MLKCEGTISDVCSQFGDEYSGQSGLDHGVGELVLTLRCYIDDGAL